MFGVLGVLIGVLGVLIGVLGVLVGRLGVLAAGGSGGDKYEVWSTLT